MEIAEKNVQKDESKNLHYSYVRPPVCTYTPRHATPRHDTLLLVLF